MLHYIKQKFFGGTVNNEYKTFFHSISQNSKWYMIQDPSKMILHV